MKATDQAKIDRARNMIRDFGPPRGSLWIDSRTGKTVTVICCALIVDAHTPIVVYSDFDQSWCINLDDWSGEIPGPNLSPVRRFVPRNP